LAVNHTFFLPDVFLSSFFPPPWLFLFQFFLCSVNLTSPSRGDVSSLRRYENRSMPEFPPLRMLPFLFEWPCLVNVLSPRFLGCQSPRSHQPSRISPTFCPSICDCTRPPRSFDSPSRTYSDGLSCLNPLSTFSYCSFSSYFLSFSPPPLL